MSVETKYEIEWYVDAEGNAPVYRWLTQELTEDAREVVGAALFEILQADGPGVCGTLFGRQLGGGVFEFRLDGDPQPWIDEARKRRGRAPRGSGLQGARVQYRVFCHAHGDKLVLLLGASDKGQDVSKKRQQEEIGIARARLEEWAQRLRPATRAARKAPGTRTSH